MVTYLSMNTWKIINNVQILKKKSQKIYGLPFTKAQRDKYLRTFRLENYRFGFFNNIMRWKLKNLQVKKINPIQRSVFNNMCLKININSNRNYFCNWHLYTLYTISFFLQPRHRAPNGTPPKSRDHINAVVDVNMWETRLDPIYFYYFASTKKSFPSPPVSLFNLRNFYLRAIIPSFTVIFSCTHSLLRNYWFTVVRWSTRRSLF